MSEEPDDDYAIHLRLAREDIDKWRTIAERLAEALIEIKSSVDDGYCCGEENEADCETHRKRFLSNKVLYEYEKAREEK